MPFEKVNCSAVFEPTSPYTQAVISRGSKLLTISGQVSVDAEGNLVGKGNVEAQTNQALTNMKALVEAAGGKMSDIFRLGIYLLDRGHFPIVMEARRRFFTAPFPAATGIVVSSLANADWLVELEATAHIA